MLKQRTFIHQNIKYDFNWNLDNHKNKLFQVNSNLEEFKRLGKYLKEIYKSGVPSNLFNKRDVPRISQFKIKGLKSSFLRSFSKKLILNNIIQKSDGDSKLPNFAQSVYKSFRENQMNKNPGHEPILKNILIKDKDSIAIEILIWMKNKENNFITGHIDLIQIQGNTIKVIDYKPEGEFLFSLPQVATYGILIKKLLNLDSIKCISFNKNIAWEYDPMILISDIKNFLTLNKVNRPWEEYL